MVNFNSKLKIKKEQASVILNGKEIDIYQVEDGSITLDEYRTARANSAGFAVLYTKLNNEALRAATLNHLKNIFVKEDEPTYDSSLVYNIVPLLLERLQQAEDNAK